MKKITCLLTAFMIVMTTGCPNGVPKRPEQIKKIVKDEMSKLNHFQIEYDCAHYCICKDQSADQSADQRADQSAGKSADQSAGKSAGKGSGEKPDLCEPKKQKAKEIRDAATYRLVRLIDYSYFEFENDLYVGRATGSFLADAVGFGGDLAATITNGERAKTIINASLLAFRGTRKAGSIHFFKEKTADVLIIKMQASRNRVMAELLEQLEKPVDDYPLEAALGDVIRYFYAGTLARALQELQAGASLDASKAASDVRNVKGLSEPGLLTEDDVQLKRQSQETLTNLEKALGGEDKNAAESRINSILNELKKEPNFKADFDRNPITDNAAPDAIIKVIRKIKRDKSDAADEAGLKKINEIIVKFGKLSNVEDQ